METEQEQRYYKELPVQLTDGEKLTKMGRVLELEDIQEVVKEEAKEAADEAKKEIADHQKEIDKLKGHLRSGTEPRQVECIDVQDFKAKSVRTMRTDTGEVVSERAMRQDELQGELALREGQSEVEETWGGQEGTDSKVH